MEQTKLKSHIVPITDTIKVEMKYPSYDDVLRNPNYMKKDMNEVEAIFDSISACMHAVQTGDDNIIVSQEPKEEVEKFINSLTTDQLTKITDFVQSIPTLTHEQNFTCKKCGHENTLALKGLQDFF